MEKKLKLIISQILNVDVQSIDENFSKDNCESWDSINQMALINTLEEEFNIRFSDEEVLQLLSYQLIKIILKEHGVQ